MRGFQPEAVRFHHSVQRPEAWYATHVVALTLQVRIRFLEADLDSEAAAAKALCVAPRADIVVVGELLVFLLP